MKGFLFFLCFCLFLYLSRRMTTVAQNVVQPGTGDISARGSLGSTCLKNGRVRVANIHNQNNFSSCLHLKQTLNRF